MSSTRSSDITCYAHGSTTHTEAPEDGAQSGEDGHPPGQVRTGLNIGSTRQLPALEYLKSFKPCR